VQQYGYEWDQSCDKVTTGGHNICYDPPGASPPHCILATAELCDPATAPASCPSATQVRYCTSEYYYDTKPCLSNEHCDSGKCCDNDHPTICF
jgi:hypothetical protein